MQLTGPDYLLGAASTAADQGHPFAEDFQRMIMDCFSGGQLIREVIARRELKEHELAPVGVILGALEMAAHHNDDESYQEALQVGLSLLAKWPAYLIGGGTYNDHPDFTARSEGD